MTLGLCSQIDLDFEVEKAAKNAPPQEAAAEGATLLPASETTAAAALAEAAAAKDTPADEERQADAVFAKLKSMTAPADDDDEQ